MTNNALARVQLLDWQTGLQILITSKSSLRNLFTNMNEGFDIWVKRPRAITRLSLLTSLLNNQVFL